MFDRWCRWSFCCCVFFCRPNDGDGATVAGRGDPGGGLGERRGRFVGGDRKKTVAVRGLPVVVAELDGVPAGTTSALDPALHACHRAQQTTVRFPLRTQPTLADTVP